MILTTTTQKLQVFFAGAKATNDCPIVIDWVDYSASATTPGMTPSNSNGVTTTDILAAPAASTQRKVNSISLFNADTASVVVTIQINDNATLYPVVSAMTIPIGATLQYTDRRGWSVLIGGATRLSLPNNVQEFTASGTWTNPGGYRYALVECVGGGGGGGNGYFNCPDPGYGAGGGGGKRTRVLLNAGLLPVTVTITVGAGGAGGAATAAYNPGTAGGASSFGTYLYAYGGGGGTSGQGGTAGGGGGGGTSAGVTSTGGAAFAVASGISADDRGGAGSAGAATGSYLGGGGGGGGSTIGGGYSWFSAGGAGGFNATGGGAGSTASTATNVAGVPDVLGCGTGAGSPPANTTGKAGGFPGGGGSGAFDQSSPIVAGGAGGGGVVRVWCW